jgi:hypothetical protein
MIDPIAQAAGFLAAGKAGLELMRAALSLMPKGDEKEKIGAKLAEAEIALELTNAKLAQDLGYPLCRCVFPPRPMLWDKAKGAFVCGELGCGRVASAE